MAEEIQEHELCEDEYCEICQENDDAVWSSFADRWLDRDDAVWSEWHDDYLPDDIVTWSSWHDTYILTDEAVYSQWLGTSIRQDEAVLCRYLDDYVPGDSDDVVWSETSDDYVVIPHDQAVWSELLGEYVWQDDLPRCSECGCDDILTADAIYEFVSEDGSRKLLCESCLPVDVRQLECGRASRPLRGGTAVVAYSDDVVSTPFGLAMRSNCTPLCSDSGGQDVWVPSEHVASVLDSYGLGQLIVSPLAVSLGLVPKAWIANDFYRPVKVVTSREQTVLEITGFTPEYDFVVPITDTTIDTTIRTSVSLDSMIFDIYVHRDRLYAVDTAIADEWLRDHPGAVFASADQLRNEDCLDCRPRFTVFFLNIVKERLHTRTPFGHLWQTRQEELLTPSTKRRAVMALRNYSDSLDYKVIGSGAMSFGLEMEFDNISKNRAVKAIASAIPEWDSGPLFGVKPDSSTHDGCEVITQPFTASGYAEIRPILKAAIDNIVEAGGSASGGAGLHVHLGGVYVNLRQTATMLSVLSGTGGHWLARFVGRKSDRQLNSYAQLPSGMQCATLADDGITNDAKKSALGRYSAINVHPWPKTVEFRLFDAATCIEHVDLALEFVDALYAYSRKREPRHASAWDFVQFARQGDWATLNQVLSNF